MSKRALLTRRYWLYAASLLAAALVFRLDVLSPPRLLTIAVLALMWEAFSYKFPRWMTLAMEGGRLRDVCALAGIVALVCLTNSLTMLIFFRAGAVVLVSSLVITLICASCLGFTVLAVFFWFIIRIKEEKKELRETNPRQQSTLEEVGELQGLLPICAWCKKIRNDQGYWMKVEEYLDNHSGAKVSIHICPQCGGQEH